MLADCGLVGRILLRRRALVPLMEAPTHAQRSSLAARSAPSLPRFPWRFSYAGPGVRGAVIVGRHPKTFTIGDIPGLAWYACCKDDCEGRDSRLLLNGEPLQLGQTRRIGFVSLPPDSAAIFKSAGKYLWEGRIIGEAVVQR
jgi:hypothetical protein